MYFPTELDEVSDLQLIAELTRRLKILSQNKCTYCERYIKLCSCKLEKQEGRDRSESELRQRIQRMLYIAVK